MKELKYKVGDKFKGKSIYDTEIIDILEDNTHPYVCRWTDSNGDILRSAFPEYTLNGWGYVKEESKTKFKLGDLVEYTDGHSNEFPLGKPYEVRGVVDRGESIILKNVSGGVQIVKSSGFSLSKNEPKPKEEFGMSDGEFVYEHNLVFGGYIIDSKGQISQIQGFDIDGNIYTSYGKLIEIEDFLDEYRPLGADRYFHKTPITPSKIFWTNPDDEADFEKLDSTYCDDDCTCFYCSPHPQAEKILIQSDGTNWHQIKEPGTIKHIECDCGAKHTSRPTYHSNWCSIKGLENE